MARTGTGLVSEMAQSRYLEIERTQGEDDKGIETVSTHERRKQGVMAYSDASFRVLLVGESNAGHTIRFFVE